MLEPALFLVQALGPHLLEEIPFPPDIPTVVQHLAEQFTAVITQVLGIIGATVIYISRLAYVTIVSLGILLHSTHVNRRLGMDLIRGGIALAILAEFVYPLLKY